MFKTTPTKGKSICQALNKVNPGITDIFLLRSVPILGGFPSQSWRRSWQQVVQLNILRVQFVNVIFALKWVVNELTMKFSACLLLEILAQLLDVFFCSLKWDAVYVLLKSWWLASEFLNELLELRLFVISPQQCPWRLVQVLVVKCVQQVEIKPEFLHCSFNSMPQVLLWHLVKWLSNQNLEHLKRLYV